MVTVLHQSEHDVVLGEPRHQLDRVTPRHVRIFDALQGKFGFGKGCSCSGCGCGLILLLFFVALFCSIVTGTDWTHLGFHALLPIF